jgi:hypothetical protein
MSEGGKGIDVSGGVFISYRREDSRGSARLIRDRLASHLGPDSIFFDIDSIAPGVDFVDAITKQIGECEAVVAVIGKYWISSSDKDSRRRLDDPNDPVRIEIQAALERGLRVIPVSVDGATMPKAEDLPDDIKKLSRRSGIEISDTRFDYDVDRLAQTLQRPAGRKSEPHEAALVREKTYQARQVATAETRQRNEEPQAREAAGADRVVRVERNEPAVADRSQREPPSSLMSSLA